ncbi:MAG: sulfite exporter TauE/SafE family protein [Myxococcota bacterium]
MSPETIATLAAACLLTSMLSAIVGMAGGIVLLSVMLLFLDPLVAIPLHGTIQLVSNSSRTLIQRQHVRWRIIGSYVVFLLPGSIVGLFIAQALPATVARLVIGVFVIVATWMPSALFMGTHPESTNPHRRFVVLGGVVGTVNMTIGATGPLLAPFFLNLGLARQSIIGTKAAAQALGHLVKIVVFGFAGFAFAEYALPSACSAPW